MTGTGSISALAAYETNSNCLISTEGGFKHDTEAADLCVGQNRLSGEPLTAKAAGDAMERAHMATERHLHAWLITGTERHLDLAKAHIDQLIALSRIHQRSHS
jgi:hypothetical protein